MTKENPYRAAGAFDGVSYVERDADVKLYEAILDNQRYPYCLAPRQSGKSSLMAYMMKKLDSSQFKVIFIDIYEMASFNPNSLEDYNVFLKAFTTKILSSFNSHPPAVSFWSRLVQSFHYLLGHSPSFYEKMDPNDLGNILQHIATHWDNRIVIIIDEIDQLLETKFKENFFGVIRSFFNKRTTDKNFGDYWKKIQFVLTGAAQPTDLISKQHVSPFNVGAPIMLRDLSLEQVAEMSKYLCEEPKKVSDDVVSHIYKYTSGSVYLTQLVFEKLWILIDTQSTSKVNPDIVYKVVKEILDESPDSIHFLNIRSRFVKNPNLLQSFLTLVAGGKINEQDIEYLKMAGITTGERAYRNLIYERVFGHGGPVSIVDKYGEPITCWLVTEFPEQVTLNETVSLLVYFSAKVVTNRDQQVTLPKGSLVDIIIKTQDYFLIVSQKNEGQLVISNEEEMLPLQFKLKATALGKSSIQIGAFYEGKALRDISNIKISPTILEKKATKSTPIEGEQHLESISPIQLDLSLKSEQNIAYCLRTLETTTRDNSPLEWAQIMQNLGIAYANRIRGDRAENLEKGIESYQQALEIQSPKSSPLDWATTIMYFAEAYSERIRGNRANNLEQAIAYYQQALKVRTSEALPLQWAQTMQNLGTAYLNRIRGEQAENLEQAIAYYQQALEVRTREAVPLEQAQTIQNLGTAYANLIKGNHAENLERAINCYQQALTVYTSEYFPREHRKIQIQLGNLYFKEQHWQKGHQAYAAALYGNEMLYHASILPEIQEMGTVSVHNSYCLTKLGRFSEAIEVLERGKARTLGETLALEGANLVNVSENDRTAFLATRKRISALEAEARNIENSNTHDLLSISSELRIAKEELSKIIERIRCYLPKFIREKLDFISIVEIIKSVGQPLVYLCTVTHGSLAFIIPPNITEITNENVLWLDGFNENDLNSILYESNEKNGYWQAITSSGHKLTTILDEIWFLLEKIMQPIAERLNDFGYKRAVLISFGTLGLLPLHAVTSSDIVFSLIPSARALEFCYQSAIRKAQLPHVLFAVGNPLSHNIRSMPFSKIEVEEIENFFPSDSVFTLFERQVTRVSTLKDIRGASYVHFSGAGSFNVKKPLDSALLLVGNEKITLRDLLDRTLDLSTAYLVVLSASLTGLVDFKVPDEAIGFPNGFLQAGVPCVISTLWNVEDFPTALLMIRFYQLHLQENLPQAQALNQAQSWLREVTGEVIVEYYDKLYLKSGKKDLESFRAMRYYQAHLDEKPFAHPYYWAGFVFYGV